MYTLKANPVLAISEKIGTRAFFVVLFLYQVIFIFQGIDFADEGFHATFYQQIYNDPMSVQYNFMYWFSGIVGGAWLKLFAPLGLAGIRLAGVLVTTFTAIISYRLLRKYLNTAYLKLALFLIVIFNNNDPKELYYNNLSALFYVAIAYFLFTGLKQNNLVKIFLCGCLIALNTFTRLPNILQAGLVLSIIYYGWLNKSAVGVQVKQCLMVAAGFLVMLALILLGMKMVGHLDIFLNLLKLVVRLGKSSDVNSTAATVDSSGYYGFATQLKLFWSKNFISVKFVMFSAVIVLAGASVEPFIKKYISSNAIRSFLKYALLAGLLVVVLSGSKLNNTPNLIVLYFFTGITTIMSLLIIFTSRENDIKVLAFIGFFITLSYPVGSSNSILTAGIYAFWVSFPVALNEFLGFDTVRIDSLWSHEKTGEEKTALLSIDQFQMSEIKKWAIYLCMAGCLFSAYYYPMCNASERTAMRFPIHNERLRGIFTNKERADIVNGLLEASEKYVHPGDYVVAFDAIPMFHYITQTKPFLYNSYPWLYQIDVFKEQLYKAVDEKKILPVVIMQEVATNGWRGSHWPQNSTVEYDTWNLERKKIMKDFLSTYQYSEVWTNNDFKIFIPPATMNNVEMKKIN